MANSVIAKSEIPTVAQLFRVVVWLVASAVLAQSTVRQLQGENFSGTAPLPTVVVPQTGDRSLPIEVDGAKSGGVSPSPVKHLGASTMDTAPLFLPPVLYDPGAFGASSFVVGDLNGDSNPDVVLLACASDCNRNDTSVVAVLLGNGDGTFRAVMKFDLDIFSAVALAIGDFNNDGKQDVAVVGNDDVCILLGNGDGTLAPPNCSVADPAGTYPAWVTVSDVNGDGNPDLILASGPESDPDEVQVLLGNGDGTFQTGASYKVALTHFIAVADVNGDGKPDVLALGFLSQTIDVLLGNGDGTFQPAVSYASGGITYSIAVADLNGDGKPDIVAGNNCYLKGCNEIGVLLGNADGTFQPVTSYVPFGGSTFSVAVADVNGDGWLDVLASIDGSEDSSTLSVLLGNGDGTLQPPVDYNLVPAYPYFTMIAVADVNGDRRPDLIATNGRDVEVLINNTGPHSSSATTLLSNPAPAAPNQLVTYTATVTSEYAGPVTGTVTFQDRAKTVASVALSNQVATYSASYPKIGQHLITATYSGNYHSAGSTSTVLAEYIKNLPVTSSTHVATSVSPSHVGQPVTFTATVESTFGSIPDGEPVTFSDGKTVLGSVPLKGGTAAFTASTLHVGKQTIDAVYPGDAIFKSSRGHIGEDVEP